MTAAEFRNREPATKKGGRLSELTEVRAHHYGHQVVRLRYLIKILALFGAPLTEAKIARMQEQIREKGYFDG